jgi:DNA-binding MarR family transcriptional regulator
MAENTLKSAVELAMERLRKQDADAGIEQLSLTDEQKSAIAEIRNFYGAKFAEQEILKASSLRRTFDPAEREAIEAEFRRDRERLTTEQDAKIAKIRAGTK